MFKQLRPAVTVLAFMTLITGVLYPLAVTAVAQLALPAQANGSLLHNAQGEVLGSALLAQPVAGAEWFQARPSAADYASVPSGASNLAPSNPALAARIAEDAQRWQGEGQGAVPMELVTTSASGLDPHLSPAAARYQVARIAAARGIAASRLEQLIEQHVQTPLVGPAVVNVLALNLALADNSFPAKTE
jgi:K+-transporting ATPase ATPase C chain